ncbi:hypothetical protein FRX31_034082 [Thalictrum thalictroides]|uniref:Uncharacterized protein n=1 Tax=Thalictrum thalictroides TaxID=46969 RepID=A0A7J6UV55_THATH|nr:hypothetical protein FRX31_034082 [Thalictrum thalictroides]
MPSARTLATRCPLQAGWLLELDGKMKMTAKKTTYSPMDGPKKKETEAKENETNHPDSEQVPQPQQEICLQKDGKINS